jgi:NADPH2:quinone reductase
VKAIRVHEFGGPEVLRLEEVPDPKPGRGQVLVRVHAAGVNPVDTYVRAGTYPFRPALPYTPGADAAGVVEATGEGVASVAAGDRVYVAGTLTGAYAELALVAESELHSLPERLSFAQGAAIGVPYATAYRGLFQVGRAEPGEWLLVHGASGGVGIAAVQMARAAGLDVVGTAGSPEGRDLVAAEGAHHVLDHASPGYADRLLEITGGRGIDLVLEMLANVNLATDLRLLARRGRVVVIGSRGKIEIDPRDTMSRDAEIRGFSLLNATAEDRVRIHAALGAGLESGVLRPIVGVELPLAEAAEAHREVIEGRSRGKVVLRGDVSHIEHI